MGHYVVLVEKKRKEDYSKRWSTQVRREAEKAGMMFENRNNEA